MKRSRIILSICLAAVVLVIAAIPVKAYIANRKNESNLEGLMRDFSQIIAKHSQLEIVQAKSTYGKLNGNGNGIQYFGAVLVKKSSVADLETLMSELDEKFEAVECKNQESSKIESKYLEHKTLSYAASDFDGMEYLSICFFNSNHQNSDYFDILGH